MQPCQQCRQQQLHRSNSPADEPDDEIRAEQAKQKACMRRALPSRSSWLSAVSISIEWLPDEGRTIAPHLAACLLEHIGTPDTLQPDFAFPHLRQAR